MDYTAFISKVPKIKQIPLAGLAAQLKMVPAHRQELVKPKDIQKTRKAAVLMLLYPDTTSKMHTVALLRNPYNGVHANQVGLPGGKYEPTDVNYQNTALRETQEEIGVPAKDITIIRELSPLYIAPSNFMVYPFLGFLQYTPCFIADDYEVASVLEIPLEHVLQERFVSNQYKTTSYAKKIQVPVYTFTDPVIWGATAMIFSELKELLKKVE